MPEQVPYDIFSRICQEDSVSVDIGSFVLPVTVAAGFLFPIFRQTDQRIQYVIGKNLFSIPNLRLIGMVHVE